MRSAQKASDTGGAAAAAALGHQPQLGRLRQLALFDSDCDPQDLRALVSGVLERLPNLETLTLTVHVPSSAPELTGALCS